MKNSITSICIKPNATILQSLKKLGESANKCLIVINNNKKFLGTISDGDIRRDILKNKNFLNTIKNIYNPKSKFIYEKKYSSKKAKDLLTNFKIPILPVLDSKKKPKKYFTLFDFYPTQKDTKNYKKNSILIMAGGDGKRLHPFTSILPKPLIPVKNKPVIVHIMNLFKSKDFSKFIISINKKDKVLKSYLNELSNIYDIEIIQETKKLGSAGVLKRLENIKNDLFVINCDCLFNIELNQLLSFHKDNNNEMTLVAAVKQTNIPYGVCEINEKKGILKNMIEKPKKNYVVNTGFYICKPSMLKHLPKNKINFGMDLVIKNLLSKKKKIGIFPISGKDWKDTGNWTNYFDKIKNLNT